MNHSSRKDAIIFQNLSLIAFRPCMHKSTFITFCTKQPFRGIMFVFIVLSFSLFTSCNFSEYEGYKKTKSGIHFKLLTIGEDVVKAKPGDYVTADLVYKTLDDSVFFKGRRKFQLSEPKFTGSVDECFMMLSEDESAEFIVSADQFFNKTIQAPLPGFITQNSDMKIEIKILEIQTEEDYFKEKEAFLHWIEDFGDYERVILRQFIEEEELNILPHESGIYYINLKEGNGKTVEEGDTIIVDYEGKFLNGKFFDSTIKRNEPFQFVFGQQWQVVPGLEEAIGMMEEHERALFIIPSDLAFGETGSSTGIIPPFTSLIFEVELKSVKKPNI